MKMTPHNFALAQSVQESLKTFHPDAWGSGRQKTKLLWDYSPRNLLIQYFNALTTCLLSIVANPSPSTLLLLNHSSLTTTI